MNNIGLLDKPLKILILAYLVFFLLFVDIKVNAEKKEIDINTNPNGYLFKVGNIKPGDWMPRDITILNEGNKDFRYMAVLGKKKSVKGLLEELDLIVKKGEDILFNGKLNDFKGFPPRKLAEGNSETLFFQVTMPYDLGNAYQSSEAEVEIKFIAEAIGEPGGENPPGPTDDKNPPVNENPPKDESPPGDETPSGDDPVDENDPNEENSKDDKSPSENNSSTDSPEGNDAEEVNGEENTEQIVVTPEMTENLLPNTAINTYNILLMGVGLLGCGGTLIIFYLRRLRRDQ